MGIGSAFADFKKRLDYSECGVVRLVGLKAARIIRDAPESNPIKQAAIRVAAEFSAR
jgi:hypothetical protein